MSVATRCQVALECRGLISWYLVGRRQVRMCAACARAFAALDAPPPMVHPEPAPDGLLRGIGFGLVVEAAVAFAIAVMVLIAVLLVGGDA